MAVFWFGWAKKLKNIFTKQQADTYYLQKELPNQLQIVKGSVDFYKNVVIKQNGYVDRVDTNAPTSMINKRYLEEQTLSKTSTATQTVAGPVNLRSPIELGTEIKAGYGGGNVKFIPEDNSTKTLQFYNANPTDTRRFNLLVPNPTAAQNPATKQYVDNSKKYTLFWQSNDRVFNNLDSTDVNHTFTTIDTTVPWILKYDRIVKNGNVYEGSFNFSFMIPELNETIFSTNRWYFRSSTNTFEEGSRVGIIIKRKTANIIMLKIQIWEGTKAIKNIKLYRPQQ